MIGRSPAFRVMQALVGKIAAYDASVLIEGETGTGKELAARAIHYCSARRNLPFVPVNCGALQDSLVENELFGHARGAFTDARQDQAGLVELARGGTLFLDEVDALPAKGQVTLLRFLEDQHFRPLGAGREQVANVRVVAASNRSLSALVEAEKFRSDLLYRIKVMYLTLPPLRERREDIAPLSAHFLHQGSVRFGKPELEVHPDTLAWFQRYAWPGNVRELENLLLREFLLADGSHVSIPPPAGLRGGEPAASDTVLNYHFARKQAMVDFESRFLCRLLEQAHGNTSAAARISGTERRYLGKLLKKHSIRKTPA